MVYLSEPINYHYMLIFVVGLMCCGLLFAIALILQISREPEKEREKSMKVFSFDVESNGLYGFAFAIAVTVREDGHEVAQFQGRIPDELVTNEWVREHIIGPGVLSSMAITHTTSEELEEAFWAFWMQHRGTERHPAVISVAHCGHPVETGLFRRCVERKLEERLFLPAFPLHELETILLAVGEYPIGAEEYARKYGIAIPFAGTEHHPMFDAVVAAVVWEHACKRLGVK